MMRGNTMEFGSSDDRETLPDSLIDDLCRLDPEFARRAFDSYANQHRFNITALKMANEIQESLHFARMPHSRPLMKAVKDIHGKLQIDMEDSTGFNQTLFETLGIACTGDSQIQELEDLTDAYIGGYIVALDRVQNSLQLSDTELQLESIPFPAIRLRFEPIDY